MPREKTLSREEYRAAVTNLLDLGFTAPAIAYMTGKSHVAVYNMLERIGRKTGRSFTRLDSPEVDPNAIRFVSRVFAQPEIVVKSLHSHRRKVKK